MPSHAVIITSLYPRHLKNYYELSKEVNEDRQTATKIFNSYSELTIPAGKLPKRYIPTIANKIEIIINNLVKKKQNDVSIVLNTHGAPGIYDIDQSIIILLIQQLSSKRIKINTVYALFCDGFTSQSFREQWPFLYARPTHQKAPSLFLLGRKLNHLATKIPQHFLIRGFDKAYDPVADQREVVDVLRGTGGKVLLVKTKTEEKKVDCVLIRKAIKACSIKYSELKTAAQKAAYEEASNVLGSVFEEMNRNVHRFLSEEGALNQENKSFYRAVLSHAEIKEKPSVESFRLAYERWKKEVKLFDVRKQQVFLDYCDVKESVTDSPSTDDSTPHRSERGQEGPALTSLRERPLRPMSCIPLSHFSRYSPMDKTPVNPYNRGAIILLKDGPVSPHPPGLK